MPSEKVLNFHDLNMFQVITSLDFVQLLNVIAKNDLMTGLLAEYYCELSLLQSELGTMSQAQVAASCILLARLTRKTGLLILYPAHVLY